MKNIGIITHNFPADINDRQNAGIFVGDIARAIAKKQNVSVFCPGKRNKRYKMTNVNVTNFKVGNKKLGDITLSNPVDIVRLFLFFLSGFTSLPRFIDSSQADINIAMWAFPSGAFAYFAKKIFGKPYVVWCLGSDIYVYGKKPILKVVIRHILKNAAFVFADGIDLANKAEKLSGRECIFIPSASNAQYKKSSKKVSLDFISLTFIGRLEPVKGADIFIESLVRIKKDINKFKINIIGAGSLIEGLKKRAIDENINRQITFYGNINEFQTIGKVLKNSDWIIIPSRSDSIPLVFSEAMKCHTPVIASNLPDLSYLVNTYKVGYLFSSGSFRQLADIIVKLPKLKKQRERFSKNTILAAKDFSVERSSRRILSYIKKYEQN